MPGSGTESTFVPCTAENPCSVLVVDDEVSLRQVIKYGARLDGGFHILECGTLADGLASLSERVPDVVVLDLNLPDSMQLHTLDSVIQAVADMVPVVVLTGDLDEGQEYELLARGAQDVLLKGVHIDVPMILRACRKARARHERRRRQAEIIQSATQRADDSESLKRLDKGISELKMLVAGQPPD